MKQDIHILEKLTDKYLKKSSSDKEDRLLDNFALLYNTDCWETEKMGKKKEVSEIILKNISTEIIHRKKLKYLELVKYSVSMAACILFFIGITFLWKPSNNNLIFVKAIKKIDTVQLIDGSIIYLSPNTTLSYSNDFNKNTREVNLIEGNAFFKVARNPNKPFIITSGDIKTKVLGTSFNIQMTNNSCMVTVYSGKVNVSFKTESVNLIQSEEANFFIHNQTLTKKILPSSELINWYKNDLELKHVSLQQILNLLQKKYGATITIRDKKILKIKATIFIDKKASLNSVIDQLNYITNLNIKANGDLISIK